MASVIVSFMLLLIVSVVAVKVIESFALCSCGFTKAAEVVVPPRESSKAEIPGRVYISWIWSVLSLGKAESEFEPA